MEGRGKGGEKGGVCIIHVEEVNRVVGHIQVYMYQPQTLHIRETYSGIHVPHVQLGFQMLPAAC